MIESEIKVLIIDDSSSDRRLYQELLAESTRPRFRVETADRLEAGLNLLAEQQPDVVLLDLLLPDSQGLGSFRRAHMQEPHIPIVVLSDLNDEAVAVQTVQEGAQDYLVKSELEPNLLARSLHNPLNRRVLCDMLKGWGMTPTAAATANEGLRLAREAADGGREFRLILADVEMPEVDGFSFANSIRQERKLSKPALIMLTSAERSGNTDRCEQLGGAAHLLKPVKARELFDTALTVLERVARHVDVEDASDQLDTTGRPLHCLLAEDSVFNQKLAIGLLGKRGHQVTVAENGRQAVDLSAQQDFDLVLMDVQMPLMDGLQATAAIRKREQGTGRRLPIVALTAHAMKGDRERCLLAGMDGYLSKPFRSHELFAAMEAVLNGQDDRLASAEDAAG